MSGNFDPNFLVRSAEVARSGRMTHAQRQRADADAAVVRVLTRSPATINRIASSSLRSVEGVRSILLRMETEGKVRRVADHGPRADLWELVPDDAC